MGKYTRNIMIKFTSKKLVTSLIATLAISTASLSAQDFGSVNGDKITKEDVAVVLRNPNINFEALPKKSKNKILDQVIEKKLLAGMRLKVELTKNLHTKLL